MMLWTDHQKRPWSHIFREIYRERCRDDDGYRYYVVVLEDEIGVTTYRLDDGRPVRFIDDCEFEIVESGCCFRGARTSLTKQLNEWRSEP